MGFCCPNCDFYVDGTTCKRLKEKVEVRVEKHKKDIQIAQEILEKFKISNKDLEKYP